MKVYGLLFNAIIMLYSCFFFADIKIRGKRKLSPCPETLLRWYPIADETHIGFCKRSHLGRVKIRAKFLGLAIWYPVPA